MLSSEIIVVLLTNESQKRTKVNNAYFLPDINLNNDSEIDFIFDQILYMVKFIAIILFSFGFLLFLRLQFVIIFFVGLYARFF